MRAQFAARVPEILDWELRLKGELCRATFSHSAVVAFCVIRFRPRGSSNVGRVRGGCMKDPETRHACAMKTSCVVSHTG